MPKSRASYPTEFRQQIVELVRANCPPKELTKKFEPTAQTIHKLGETGQPWCTSPRWADQEGQRPAL